MKKVKSLIAEMLIIIVAVLAVIVSLAFMFNGNVDKTNYDHDDMMSDNSAYQKLRECFVKSGSEFEREFGDTLTDQKTYLHLFDFGKMSKKFYGVYPKITSKETDRGAIKYCYQVKLKKYEVDLITIIYEDTVTSEMQVYCVTGAYRSKQKTSALNTENFVVNARSSNNVVPPFVMERETFIDFLNLVESGNLENTDEKPFQGLKILHDFYPVDGGFEEDIY